MMLVQNLELDQLIISKLIFFFILITYLVDIVLVLLGEILSWSLMGVIIIIIIIIIIITIITIIKIKIII